jgi:hypothetical protein
MCGVDYGSYIAAAVYIYIIEVKREEGKIQRA